MSLPSTIRRGGVAIAAAALVLSACSSGTGASPAAGSAAPASASASQSAPTGATMEITVATNAKVGSYLAGEDGKTLYIFKKDTANKSNCTDQCAGLWPPLTVDSGGQVKAAAGVTGAFTTFARADGNMQVSYKDAPLYYYTPDKAAGDVNGQGVGGVWFVATP